MSRSMLFRTAGSCLVAVGVSAAVAAAPASATDPSDQRNPPRQAAAVQPRPAPGQLRRLGEPTPVGGGIRPVGGDIRPVGGDIGVSGGGIRPINVGSPLQNDRSFYSRVRPHTTAVGVSGYAIEPGWDDPPWGPREVLRPASSFDSSASGGVGNAGFGPGVDTSGVANPAVGDAIQRRYVPAQAWRVAPRAPRQAASGRAIDRGSDSDWVDPTPIPPLAARPRRDVRPDLRMAVRLSLEDRMPGAIDAVRQAVYREPEAFDTAAGAIFSDPQMLAKVDEAIAAYRAAPNTQVSASDAEFMVAVLSAAAGRGDEAFAAIQRARQLGENRPSGKSLHRVLSRGRVTLPAGDATPPAEGLP